MFEFGAEIISRICKAVKKRALAFLAGFAFALLCFVVSNVLKTSGINVKINCFQHKQGRKRLWKL
jgi:hypothetical protein